MERILTVTTTYSLRKSAADRKKTKFEKGKPRWDQEKIYAQRQKVQDTIQEKLGEIECKSGKCNFSGTVLINLCQII
jgi:hypothetical protein